MGVYRGFSEGCEGVCVQWMCIEGFPRGVRECVVCVRV